MLNSHHFVIFLLYSGSSLWRLLMDSLTNMTWPIPTLTPKESWSSVVSSNLNLPKPLILSVIFNKLIRFSKTCLNAVCSNSQLVARRLNVAKLTFLKAMKNIFIVKILKSTKIHTNTKITRAQSHVYIYVYFLLTSVQELSCENVICCLQKLLALTCDMRIWEKNWTTSEPKFNFHVFIFHVRFVRFYTRKEKKTPKSPILHQFWSGG